MGVKIRHARFHHLVEMGAVAVEIEVDFCSIDIGDAALIVEVVVVVGEVRLAEVGLGVVNDELDFLGGGDVEHPLDFVNHFGRFRQRVLGELFSRRVEVNVELGGAVVLPVLLLVLHAVFAKGEL